MIKIIGEKTATPGSRYCFTVSGSGSGANVVISSGDSKILPTVTYDPKTQCLHYCFVVPRGATTVNIFASGPGGRDAQLTVHVMP